MQDWDIYKAAALDYSKLRPRFVRATLTPTVATKEVELPADCISVISVGWGVEASYEEIYSTSETQAWYYEPGLLVISPATTEEDTEITITYRAFHLPDEDSLTFPTIPKADLPYVDDLEQSLMLGLQADEIAKGPTLYSVGQTQVSRVAALKDLRDRARELRQRVQGALDSPLAVWK